MILGRFLHSGVARSLFIAVRAVRAWCLLTVVAVLSLTQVRSLLLQQGEHRLASQAKSYGMAIFERLLLATDIAYSAGAMPARRRRERDSMANSRLHNHSRW